MKETEDLAKTHEIAAAALAAMHRHEIPAAPDSFHLWYRYCEGRDPELARSVDAVLESGRRFTRSVSDDLLRRHLADDKQTAGRLLDTSLRIGDAVGQVVNLLNTAGAGNERYGQALEAISDSLKQVGGNPALLHQLLDMVIDRTSRVRAQNEQLREELLSSSQEIDTLRRHLEEVRLEVMTDALTGIANRKFFDIHIRERTAAAMASGAPLSLLMLDIDHFKRFNDLHGHQIGDQVLRLAARTLTECVKGRDLAARYGGEEFVVILPDTALDNAIVVAEQIRRAIAGKRIVRRRTEEDLGSITMSIGVAQFVAGESSGALIRRADEALYAAKAAGRNRTLTELDLKRPLVASA